MSEPVVSVICSVRNGCSELPAVIGSIKAQTLREWEFIVIDAGSTDGTLELLLEAAQADARIRVVSLGHVPRAVGLNHAIRLARAPFIANVDADDPMHPDRLGVQVARMNREPQWDVLATKAVFLWEKDQPVWQPAADVPTASLRRLLTLRNPVYHSSVMMRKRSIMALGGYDETRRSSEDYDLWVRAAANGYGVGLMPERLASHRLHARQSFERGSRARFIQGSLGIQRRAIRALGGPSYAYCLVMLRACWAFLPRRLRFACYRRFRPWQGSGRSGANPTPGAVGSQLVEEPT